ncbi:TPA: hypothetical protein ACSJ2Y_004633 [Escherichia coli]|uniref:hypothetical protein n=1 Tax=Escherichia coli TaxID=562 RepID=UPI000CFC5630|nr:hypothetical protein [Escherichia coli]MBB8133872.1 hypothetical protein [Escherichia coli]GDJ56716.1 hypothetical protein BvCmsKSNP047_02982 [Escherichia coli]
MKKVFIASAIAMSLAAGSAMAAQQDEILFHGVVTDVTCNIDTNIDGNVTNVVQLGSIQKGGTGDVKNIVLKAKGANCSGLANKTATISFMGGLGDQGVSNVNGSAEKARVELKAKNSKTPDTVINKTMNSVEFEAEKINSDGYKFEAKLISDAAGTVGTFESAVSYAVTYS